MLALSWDVSYFNLSSATQWPQDRRGGWKINRDLPLDLRVGHGRSLKVLLSEDAGGSSLPELPSLAAALRLCQDFFHHDFPHPALWVGSDVGSSNLQ